MVNTMKNQIVELDGRLMIDARQAFHPILQDGRISSDGDKLGVNRTGMFAQVCAST